MDDRGLPPGGRLTPDPMILQVRTSAGTCLLERAEPADKPPCPECLLSRLREAGFSVQAPLEPYDDRLLDTSLVRRLGRAEGPAAPVIRLFRGEAHLHSLLPVPSCPVCGPGQKRAGARPPLPVGLLKDPLLGMTSSFEIEDMDRDPRRLCSTVRGRIHMPDARDIDYSYGLDTTVDGALSAQLGEAVERYCATRPDHRRLIASSIAQLRSRTLPAGSWRAYDREQLGRLDYRRLSRTETIHWIEGQALSDGRSVLVPAATVFLRRSWNPEEARFFPLVSHGLACHLTAAEARRRALLELYERYHLTAAWHRRSFGRRIPDGLWRGWLGRLAERIRGSRLSLLLTALVTPPSTSVVLALLSGRAFPWITLGAAAGEDLVVAATRAALEACGGWQTVSRAFQESDVPDKLPAVAGAGEHSLYYLRRDRAEWLAATIREGIAGTADVKSPGAAAEIEAEVLALSPRALAVSVTTPDVAACGLEVVKAVAPGVPLFQFGAVGAPHLWLDGLGLPRRAEPHPYP